MAKSSYVLSGIDMDLARIMVFVEMTTENKPQRGAKAKFCPGKRFKRGKWGCGPYR